MTSGFVAASRAIPNGCSSAFTARRSRVPPMPRRQRIEPLARVVSLRASHSAEAKARRDELDVGSRASERRSTASGRRAACRRADRRRRHASAANVRRGVGRIPRMTYAEARAQFPVLERLAYLQAGSVGPLARGTTEAMRAAEETRTPRRSRRTRPVHASAARPVRSSATRSPRSSACRPTRSR